MKGEDLPPFDELMLTWNGTRPTEGKYLFYVSVKINDWTPWFKYASWGSDGQASCNNNPNESPVKIYQDAFEVLGGQKASGYQIKIIPEGNALPDKVHSLHVYTNSDKSPEPRQTISYSLPVCLPLKGLSQMTVNHVRCKDLCSPTSTTAVVHYLLNKSQVDPVHFAENSWDGGFDIFGNWVFNAAQAAAELGPKWNCWVERLSGFDDIYLGLLQGMPTITSVRGPLPRSAQPYAKGHLMVVIGYEPKQKKVICMDPAFPMDEKTIVHYDFSDFLQAWNRRGRVAYVFSKRASVST